MGRDSASEDAQRSRPSSASNSSNEVSGWYCSRFMFSLKCGALFGRTAFSYDCQVWSSMMRYPPGVSDDEHFLKKVFRPWSRCSRCIHLMTWARQVSFLHQQKFVQSLHLRPGSHRRDLAYLDLPPQPNRQGQSSRGATQSLSRKLSLCVPQQT